MRQIGLTRTHLGILGYVYKGERTVSDIASHVGRSAPWTSECVQHLVGMDLVLKEKTGLEVRVRPASNELAKGLELLMVEAPMLDLQVLLDKAGLRLLPVLLEPGATTGEMAGRTGLSLPTIRGKLKVWRGMGVVARDRSSKRYRLRVGHVELVSFVISFSRWRNRRALAEVLPGALIVWQWRDEYLFSIDGHVDLPGFPNAGPTRLVELGYDILHSREYYFHNPLIDVVSEEEALVQSLRTDPKNPRMERFVVEGIESRGADPRAIMEFGEKYGMNIVERRLFNPSRP
jgi:DNA-binding transcriptional ArsR family regulator